jgi:hypothetical protein
VKLPSKPLGGLRSTQGREHINDRGPWKVDPFAKTLASWLADKPLGVSIVGIDGQPRDVSPKQHPSKDELQRRLRFAALQAREAFLEQTEVPVGPALTRWGERDWDQIYRRPGIPMREYQQRVKAARLAVQSLLKCNFEHIPDPPYLLEWEVPADEFARERYWKEFYRELGGYHADFFEKLEKANDTLLEVEAGLAKSIGRKGVKGNVQLRAGSLAVWACTLGFAASADLHNQLPARLVRDIRRAVWRDACLPTAKKTRSGFDEDAWIDKQLKPFAKPSTK